MGKHSVGFFVFNPCTCAQFHFEGVCQSAHRRKQAKTPCTHKHLTCVHANHWQPRITKMESKTPTEADPGQERAILSCLTHTSLHTFSQPLTASCPAFGSASPPSKANTSFHSPLRSLALYPSNIKSNIKALL